MDNAAKQLRSELAAARQRAADAAAALQQRDSELHQTRAALKAAEAAKEKEESARATDLAQLRKAQEATVAQLHAELRTAAEAHRMAQMVLREEVTAANSRVQEKEQEWGTLEARRSPLLVAFALHASLLVCDFDFGFALCGTCMRCVRRVLLHLMYCTGGGRWMLGCVLEALLASVCGTAPH